MEVGDETLGLAELGEELAGAEGAEEVVGRMVERVRGHQTDDVTAVVLRRRPIPKPARRGRAA